MKPQSDYLLRALLEDRQIDRSGAERASALAQAEGLEIDEALVAAGVAGAQQVAVARAMLCETSYVDLDLYEIDIGNAGLVPRAVAEKHCAFPLFVLDGVATVGFADPLNIRALDQMRQILRCEVDAVLCVRSALSALIAKAYSLRSGAEEQAAGRTSDEDEGALRDEPIVAAVNQIVSDAITQNASDVHLSPDEHALQLRYRIDGELQARQGPPLSVHAALVQRLKVMAQLDLTQSRRPQDGKFRFMHKGSAYDIRMSTIPTVNGENVVLRVLRPHGQIHDLAELGIGDAVRTRLEALLDHPHGMVLVTGPTGSGKTTTLYSALKRLNTPDRNVMTIEDPVEIRVHGIRQVQANAEIGMTFAGALRSMLRQDPDVILLGEIRDCETALIATQASLTGHLVLSTLHTNDAPGALTRLRDLGVPPFVVNAALLGVLGQRLVRRLCTHCAEPREIDPVLARRFSISTGGERMLAARGCARCGQTGYRGRIGLYELLVVSPDLAERLDHGESARQIGEAAAAQGMAPMWADGLAKARAGLTSLDEVARAVAAHDSEAPMAQCEVAPAPILEQERVAA